MPDYEGRCGCGASRLALSLPKPLQDYTPRRCDCDYCLVREGIYLSDSRGEAVIHSSRPLREERQGSGTARMLLCAACGDLLAAAALLSGGLRGAVRAPLLDDAQCLPAPEDVSPKLLGVDDKQTRWSASWLALRLDDGRASQDFARAG